MGVRWMRSSCRLQEVRLATSIKTLHLTGVKYPGIFVYSAEIYKHEAAVSEHFYG
jgi:hypothetical protein